MFNFYDFVTREAKPFPWESKLVWLLRRDFKRGVLRGFKKALPGVWKCFDEAEFHRRIARLKREGKILDKGELLAAYLRTDTGKESLAKSMAFRIRESRDYAKLTVL